MKKLLFFLLFTPVFVFGQTPTCVTYSPDTADTPNAACLACPGNNWSNPMNVMVADGAASTCAMTANGNCFQSSCYYTRYLYASGFGFAIPANAVIDSILVDILRATNSPASARDSIVELTDGVTPLGANLYTTTLWPTNLTTASYGHSNPLWSYTWTPAIINATGFGVEMKALNISPLPSTAAVDHIQVTVCYTTPNGIHSVTSSPSDIKWITGGDLYSAIVPLNGVTDCSQYIYTADGKLVLEEHDRNASTPEKIFTVDPSQFADGIYLWRIEVGVASYSQKIVIAKK